jgi:hypothetical protein
MRGSKASINRSKLGCLLLSAFITACASSVGPQNPESSVPSTASARTVADLQIVDCLLPGQVRKLGQQMSFLTAGRAVKTTSSDCEIRGGQYVAYDRSNYTTALNVWQPQAQAGDQIAQNYVGEIYEKGLGTAPDYAQAAQWYRKSAEQGNNRAQTNLGYLYEKGLGVPQDYAAALNWYRKASGLDSAIALDTGEADTLRQELAQSRRSESALRQELQETKRRLEDAQQALKKRQGQAALQQRQWEQAKVALLQQQRQAVASGDQAQVQRLESELKTRNDEAERSRSELAKLEQEAARYRQQVATLEREHKAKPAPAQRQLTRQEPVEQPGNPSGSTSAEADITGPRIEFIGPKIEIIDPPITLNRGIGARIKAGAVSERNIVGKATSSLGIRELTVNDRLAQFDDKGLFHTSIPIQSTDTPVNVVAIDNGGKQARVDFMLIPDRGIGIVVDPNKTAPIAPTGSGTYYALLIGNTDYAHLPTLNTPIRDVQEIGGVLRDKYGFKVKTLTNATRFQILSALHAMREQLAANDSLIIYYAGHGELDKVNKRGHWLPVDAERNNPSNWISNVDVTDTINLMPAKHVLVIADSCYSGTLTRSALAQLDDNASKSSKDNWFKALGSRRSRTVLSSGGEVPVPDSGGSDPGHSLFASALLQVLQANGDVLEGARLYREVAARVAYAASRAKVEQTPEYAPVKFAGHEAGDFLLVPMLKTGWLDAPATLAFTVTVNRE